MLLNYNDQSIFIIPETNIENFSLKSVFDTRMNLDIYKLTHL